MLLSPGAVRMGRAVPMRRRPVPAHGWSRRTLTPAGWQTSPWVDRWMPVTRRPLSRFSTACRVSPLRHSTIGRQKSTSWADVAEEVQQHQAEVFRVSGRATHVERVNLLAEAAERFEFDHYFRVSFELEPERWPAVLCVRSVPRAWPEKGSLDERAAAYGLLLKTGERQGTQPAVDFCGGAHDVVSGSGERGPRSGPGPGLSRRIGDGPRTVRRSARQRSQAAGRGKTASVSTNCWPL